MIGKYTLALYATFAVALAGGTASASAAALACGDVITDDRKLHADLDCTGHAGPGVTIGADGVKLNLNGHTITGPDDQNGIYAAAKRKRVTIENGAISGYNHAVEMISGGRDLKLSDLKLTVQDPGGFNSMGIDIGYFRHVRMDHLRIRDANYGLFAFENRDLVLRDSRIRAGNATGQTIGANIDSNTGLVDHVRVKAATYGFYLSGPTTGFKVTDSVANGGANIGFNIANTDGPRAYAVKRNTANDNDNYGFYAAKRVRHSGGNHASGNGVEDCHNLKCV